MYTFSICFATTTFHLYLRVSIFYYKANGKAFQCLLKRFGPRGILLKFVQLQEGWLSILELFEGSLERFEFFKVLLCYLEYSTLH